MQLNFTILARWARRLVPRPHGVNIAVASAILGLLLVAARSDATELKQATLQAWDTYVQTIDTTVDQRATGSSPFLWVDETPDSLRRVRSGEFVVTNHDPRKVPQGLIHHWFGAMFVPNVTIDGVLNVLDNYDRYSDFYKPLVVKAAVLDRTDSDEKVNVVMVQTAFSVTAAVDTDSDVHIVRLSPDKVYIVSKAVRVAEIADFGKPSEHPFPEDQRPGYVWRTLDVTRLEQRDGGVYVEMETVALSRGIPIEFRWIIKPVTDSLPRKIMLDTLKATQDAVNAQDSAKPNQSQNAAEGGARQ
jgi:hypothetical protein